jgi:hypothetical protein
MNHHHRCCTSPCSPSMARGSRQAPAPLIGFTSPTPISAVCEVQERGAAMHRLPVFLDELRLAHTGLYSVLGWTRHVFCSANPTGPDRASAAVTLRTSRRALDGRSRSVSASSSPPRVRVSATERADVAAASAANDRPGPAHFRKVTSVDVYSRVQYSTSVQ